MRSPWPAPLLTLRLAIAAASLPPIGITAAPAHAQQLDSIDHGGQCPVDAAPTHPGCTPIITRTLQDREKLTLIIKNTCPDLFNYTVVAIPAHETGELSGAGATPCTARKVIDIVHDSQYGGYVVHVTRKQGSPAAGEMSITIAVRTARFEIGFGGGFALNGLTSPKYELRPLQTAADAGGNATAKYRLTREVEREDDVGQSVVSLVHISHTAWGWKFGRPALTFGLGVEPARAGDYYLGASWLLGDGAAITGGYMVGQVNTLPAGRQLGDTLTDANALANLGTRRGGTWFVGISYRFLGNGAADLKKPFLGENAPEVASSSKGGAGGESELKVDSSIVLTVVGDPKPVANATMALVVEVQQNGKVLKGAAVTFVPLSDDTKIDPDRRNTGDNGQATTRVEVGNLASGASVKVEVTACTAAACSKPRPLEFRANE